MTSLNHTRVYRRGKTGCLTCRIRKVKCDEERPACHRCTSTGRSCDGYEQLAATGRTVAQATRQRLVPAPLQQAADVILIPVQDSLDLSHDEAVGFHFFRDNSAKSISGTFASPLWDQLVLQLSHREPTVVHAAIAVGAMHLHLRQLSTPSNGIQSNRGTFAIQQYLRSLRLLRARLDQPCQSDAIEVALIACVLFVCLEMLQGNGRGVITHLETGLRILTSQTSDGKSVFRPRVHTSCINELASVFSRLDLDTAPFAERSLDGTMLPPHLAPVALLTARDWAGFVPRSFLNLADARMYLDALINAAYHFSSKAMSAISDHMVLGMDFAKRRCYQACLSRGPLSGRLNAQWIGLKAGLARWSSAFRGMRANYRKGPPSRACLILELRYLTVRLQILTATDRREMLCDQLNASFRRIVSHADHLASAAPLDFALESGVVPSLYVTAMKCRESLTRQRAISILKRGANQEGMWPSRIVGRLMEAVAKLEEDAAAVQSPSASSDIPEHARLHTVILDGSTTPGHARLVCGRFQHETDGELRIFDTEVAVL